jgi:hypothetical protein
LYALTLALAPWERARVRLSGFWLRSFVSQSAISLLQKPINTIY